MPFARPTLSEIITRIESDYKSRIDNAQSLLRRSVLKILSRAYGAAIHLLYGYLSYIKDQPFATTADSEFLEKIGNEFGIARKPADYATGSGSGTGTVGVSIPAGTQLVSNAGQVYIVDEEATIGIAGTYSLDFTALLAGDAGNDSPSITLSYVTPVAGVNTSLTVDGGGIDSGVDIESDDDLRTRVLDRKRRPPHGGAEFDYVNWALEVPGVTRAWVFSQYMGHGTLGLAFVRDNDSSIIPDATEREEVRDYVVEHVDQLTGLNVGIPVTAEPGFFVIDVVLKSLDFSISITPNNATTQADIESKISDLIVERGGPGVTIYLSDISAAISSSALEVAHRINTPVADIAAATNEIPVLGTITWSTY